MNVYKNVYRPIQTAAQAGRVVGQLWTFEASASLQNIISHPRKTTHDAQARTRKTVYNAFRMCFQLLVSQGPCILACSFHTLKKRSRGVIWTWSAAICHLRSTTRTGRQTDSQTARQTGSHTDRQSQSQAKSGEDRQSQHSQPKQAKSGKAKQSQAKSGKVRQKHANACKSNQKHAKASKTD